MKNKNDVLKNSAIGKKAKNKIAGKENHFYLLIPAVLTFLVFIPSLNNGFVNWDESRYIVDNLLIRSNS